MADMKIVLKDGTTYEDGECGYANGHLWCWLRNTTFVKAFADFSDHSKTEEIHELRDEKENIYRGFTDMDVIKKNEYEPGRFTIDVRLSGGNISMEEVNRDGEI